MFSLFVEDIEMYLQSRLYSGICLNDICLIILLFAVSMLILSLTPEDLQLSLNNLSEYCVKGGDQKEHSIKNQDSCCCQDERNDKRNEHWVYNNDIRFNYTWNFKLIQSITQTRTYRYNYLIRLLVLQLHTGVRYGDLRRTLF